MSRYIDADKVTEAFVKAAKQVGNIGDQIAFRMMINEIPTADVRENVRGEWIENNGRYGWHCNQCNKDNVYAYITGNDGSHELQDNFCPNCGADMRRES